MSAWRARIGLVKPTHRGKTFAFWYQHCPEGVEIVPTFIGFRSGTRESFEAGFQRAEELATDLKAVGCTIIVVSGTPPFLLKGLDFERQWAKDLSAKIGLPVVTPMEPHAIALEAMGVRRVALATYYKEDLNQAIENYFARFGIESVRMPGLSATGEAEGLYATPMMALDEVSYQDVYRHCKLGLQRAGASVDAVYINGGGWDAAPAVDLLERDLRIKTVWAQAADLWYTYQRLAIHNPVANCGALLREDYVPAPQYL
jgi:arylmalonate decarboxylase